LTKDGFLIYYSVFRGSTRLTFQEGRHALSEPVWLIMGVARSPVLVCPTEPNNFDFTPGSPSQRPNGVKELTQLGEIFPLGPE